VSSSSGTSQQRGGAVGSVAGFVDERRLWSRHVEMGAIGGTPRGGVNRQALTAEDGAARAVLVRWGRALGLAASMDPIGNLFLRRTGREPGASPVVTGSHLDTQPSGGRFDGTYGVLAGLEALEAITRAEVATRHPLELVVWTNEEGCRFAPGCMGSRAFADPAVLEEMLAARDLAGVTVAEALEGTRAALASIVTPRALGGPVAAYVEAHIEQGPELEAAGCPIGLVTGIQGRRRLIVEVQGEEGHAGTLPRRRRKDALLAAVAMLGALDRLMTDPEDAVRFTVGRLVVAPNAPSVVPGHVLFTIDLRHPDATTLMDLGDRVRDVCQGHAGPCAVTVREVSLTLPVRFEGRVPEAVRAASERLGLPIMPVLSGAGHDAENLHRVAPTGMVFVPCEQGISHNEAENARPDDLAAGARVLAEVLVQLAEGDS
jgi:N-carbamoyl-L-amino-acid hydrolase